jgi:hypothetical protein
LTTRLVPLDAMVELIPHVHRPRVGELVVAEVVKVGKHVAIEDRTGLTGRIFPGDRIVVAFGNRYATDQFEGYVPRRPSRHCDLLSVGGVCGVVASRHAQVRAPTRLRVLGLVGDGQGRPVNQRSFAVEPGSNLPTGSVILVVGASMSSGKTTLGGALLRGLGRAGLRVAAAKITGTAADKDPRFYRSSGASPVLDFVDAGVPSTYMLDPEDLHRIVTSLLTRLWATSPDVVVLEVADGIFQRETAILLRSAELRAIVDHVFFAANDSLSAESGARHLRENGLPIRAVSGLVTMSPLMMQEVEAATGLPCLSPDRIAGGAAIELLRVPHMLEARTLLAAPVVGSAYLPVNGTARHDQPLPLVT